LGKGRNESKPVLVLLLADNVKLPTLHRFAAGRVRDDNDDLLCASSDKPVCGCGRGQVNEVV